MAKNHKNWGKPFGRGMEQKIFWVRESGQGSKRDKFFSKDFILMGDWCSKG
jgi:hypothetical protein